MATYLIGDLQGCYDELQQLLERISFDEKKDRLGFVGDLVNRGPQSLATLRFVKALKNPIIVLGNHDLYLLALGYGFIDKTNSSLDEVLSAPDKEDLLDWLRHQPFTHFDPTKNYFLVHAGVPPPWNIKQALGFSNEISDELSGSNFRNLLKNMYGNYPDQWDNHLQGVDRLRYIMNALTRMRFCNAQGKLDLINTTAVSTDPKHFKPWFEWLQPDCDVVFGHWAALEGKCNKPQFYALDTGCVWGGRLTALRIEDRQLFSVPGLGGPNIVSSSR